MVASVTIPRGDTTLHEYYNSADGLHRAGLLKRIAYPETVPLEEVTPVGSPVIIDNGGAGSSDADSWQTAGLGFNGTSRYVLGGDVNDVATWTFSGLTAGRYRVSATWPANTDLYTAQAPFTILDGASPRDKVLVNQRVAPNDVLDSGVMWDYLSIVEITGTSLVVKLDGSDSAYYTLADGVRIERVGDPPTSEPEIIVVAEGRNIADETGRASFGTTEIGTPVQITFTVVNVGTDTLTLSGSPAVPSGFTLVSGFGSSSLAAGASTTFAVELTAAAAGNFSGELSFASDDADEATFNFAVTGTVTTLEIVDDGDFGFQEVGTWEGSTAWGYGGDFHAEANDPGQGDQYVTWNFTGLEPGDYSVYADWVGNPLYATNAPYTIYDNTTQVDSEAVDQSHNPDDL
ncbi:MAG: choice-of-anchor D domain-containing protein, partial [Planctomycetes bacterium]|nr:choice-of-anchor D domain-containing protein [Planctomycetota bacterium]